MIRLRQGFDGQAGAAHPVAAEAIDPVTGLTERQRQVMAVIQAAMDARGVVPTVREIGSALGMQISNVHYTIGRIAARGWLRRTKGHARALAVLRRLPVDTSGEGETG